MSIPRRKRWLKFCILLGIVLLGVVVLTPLTLCWWFRIWSIGDYRVYQGLQEEHPIGMELWYGRIQPGQDMEELIARIPPHGVLRHGPYTEAIYYCCPPKMGYLMWGSLSLFAKNGKLVSANGASCTWDRVFFDALTKEEWAAYNRSAEQHYAARRREREANQKPEDPKEAVP